MKSFHHTNFGRFGGGLPTDSEGYVHLTIAGWMRAGYSRENARELVKRAKAATAAAEEALAKWRDNN